MTAPSEIVKELAQQCCDEVEGICYTEGGGDYHSFSGFDTEKALALIELYMLRVLTDAKANDD